MTDVSFDMNKTKGGTQNYSYTTPAILRETLKLADALDTPESQRVSVRVGNHGSLTELNWDSEGALPHFEEPHVQEARSALADGEPIFATLEIPLGNKTGEATVVIQEAEEEADAIQLWNRGHISLLAHTKPHSCELGKYSSLVYIDLGDPLSDAVNLMEGPAHLRMDKSLHRFKNLHHVPAYHLVDYLQKAPGRILELLRKEPTEAVSWLDDIFSTNRQGTTQPGGTGVEDPLPCDECGFSPCRCPCATCGFRPCRCPCATCGNRPCVCPCKKCGRTPCDCITRHIRVENRHSDTEHGFVISALDTAPDLSGKRYVARLGYGKTNDKNPAIAPDNRTARLHLEDTVEATSADLSFDVEAQDGTVCPDRFGIYVIDQDFTVTISGLDLKKRAQVIVDFPEGGVDE